MESPKPHQRIILDADFRNPKSAMNLINVLQSRFGMVRMDSIVIYLKMASLFWSLKHNEIYYWMKDIVEASQSQKETDFNGDRFFLDLRLLCDIPAKMEETITELSFLDIGMISIHESSREVSFKEAIANKGNLEVCGVSASMNMNTEECMYNFGADSDGHIMRFAHMLMKVGVTALMCSPLQGSFLRNRSDFDNLLVICPADNVDDLVDLAEAGIDCFIIPDRCFGKTPQIQIETATRIADEIDYGLYKRNQLSKVF